ncbi:hypothetical protein GCM10011351_27050 [Paraliobacillus quinghaiensis]|uniref:DNA primase n=1 Tax=Paraliobacillus quinghaiensis TaxID=470815 RepID=A0A917TWU7_9BACI|nr:bifunctional DNA primase/polymerase [Paraliobacillus quinghaiensis]GGM39465.1 hypothetical protein GCM10011351_27050 [Paraliobacillus quinghaiensis]
MNYKKNVVKDLPVNHHKVNPKLSAAVGYSQLLQWPVFPLYSIIDGKCACDKIDCASPGKHPKIHNGFKSATTDIKTIVKWWELWPDANIGIPTGKISGFFVLDVDPKHNGHESLEQLTDYFGNLPDTVESITGSKGNHYLFKYNLGIRNKTEFLPGLDIRGDGGYIVAPPSNHLSGRQYEWELSSHPLQVKMEESPKWLVDMIGEKESHKKAKPASFWIDIMQGKEEGQRNNAATSLVGYLFRRYIDPSLVIEIMNLWNERNSPPLNQNEIKSIIESIAGKELVRRRGRTNHE